jgi:TPR repeat protein
MYEKGRGVSQDLQESAKYFLKGAQGGEITAMVKVGSLNFSGNDGLQWFQKAADLGHAGAQSILSNALRTGSKGPVNLIDSAKYSKLAAAQGEVSGFINLAIFYENGDGGLEKDLEEAAQNWEKAAELGHRIAMFNTGVNYETGAGVSKSYLEAMKWYKKCVDAHGSVEAIMKIAAFHQQGLGVVANDSEAAKYYEQGVSKGNAVAMFNLGYFHEEGKAGFVPDVIKAFELFKQSADLGDPDAELKVASMLLNGFGCEKDIPAATIYLQKASAKGNELAKSLLIRLEEIAAVSSVKK